MGLEPTPGPWQGPVLPLYYDRPNQQNSSTSWFLRQDPCSIVLRKPCTYTRRAWHRRSTWRRLSARIAVGSADLQNPCSLHDGRLSLPLGKFSGLFPVCIHSSKPLPVLVKHGHLPMLVFPPPILAKLGAFSCGFGFGHCLNISMTNGRRKYQFNQYFARNRIIV
jgi:hypothetical protein